MNRPAPVMLAPLTLLAALVGCGSPTVEVTDVGTAMEPPDAGTSATPTPARDAGSPAAPDGGFVMVHDYQPPVLWHTPTGAGAVVTLADGLLFAGTSSGLFAVDARTGEIRWRHRTAGAQPAAPVVSGGLVLFAEKDGVFRALDTRTGEARWSFEAGAAIRSIPFATAELVVFGCADGKVRALDPASGEQRWSFEAKGAVQSSPVVADGLVLFGSDGGWFYALDAKTGKRKWAVKVKGEVMCGAAVSGGKVYFGTTGAVIYALDTRRGKRVWKYEVYLGGTVIATPTVVDDRLYIVTHGYAKAMDANSGELLWSKGKGGTNDGFRIHIPKAKGYSRGDFAPLVHDGVVYLSELLGTFVALDAASGERRWSYPTGEEGGILGDITNPVHRYAIGDGVVYYQSRSGELWAFDISGKEQ